MSPLLAWLDTNWFSLLQSLGIAGGLVFTAVTVHRDARHRHVSNMLTLLEQHRDLWTEVHSRPELARVMATEVDLLTRPLTVPEERFLNLVIVHFHTGWQLARDRVIHSLAVMAADVRGYFSLPLPRAVWEQSKAQRDPEFVQFVDEALHSTDQSGPGLRK